MAAKGTIAKQNVIDTIKNAFGENYIGEFNKKIYVWADDGGEKIQISISLTCPKAAIDVQPVKKVSTGSVINFEEDAEMPAEAIEITEDERNNIEKIMKILNL